ncbi:MAG TPA: SpoIID/LytB domain-containing protein [Acidimicrobiales bacterium]|jgi:SpoIID/LytB domain protein|nr:SpoIID/LytB domain-containing protein [Acidimicrobiales bacterium]
MAFAALFGSLVFVVPAALLGLTSPAAADLNAPDRASVPALVQSSEAHALPGDGTNVRIDMTENDGLDVIVAASGNDATVSAPGAAGAAAVRFHQTGGSWEVDTGSGCGGPWTAVASNQTNPTASPVGGLLTLCVSSGSPTVHGTLTAMYNSGGAARSVNTLLLEQYVADTVPGESPSGWATLGGAGPQGMNWGFQELEAQAIAVRSYVLANLGGYGGYADTCDLTCQTYRGTAYETQTSIAAANDTAGQVMVMPAGQIATTEYSASTGGYTSSANQQSPFTPVPDDGDAVTAGGGNPNHSWSTSVSFTAIQAAWPQIGTFVNISGSTADPGHPSGTGYGRVDTISITGSVKTITIPGTEFYVDLGLKSDLFAVIGQSGSALSIIGQGWGHGIGMGQWGALGYAIGQDHGDGNWTFSQIVNHYYGPATLTQLPGGTTLAGDQPSGGVGGYWINAADGGVFSFGNAQFYGSTGGMRLNQPVVAMASTHDAAGYWEVASDGGVFSFGDAQFHGSTGSIRLNQPMVGMAVTPGGGGYWLVASDGGIFAYGNAQFYGSTGSLKLNRPVIGMVPTHDGGGYWLIASDGGLFAFGDAGFFGSLGSTPPPTPIVGVAPSPNGGGYWMLEANGTSHAFGNAPAVTLSSVSPPLATLKSPMTGLIPDFSGQGFDAVNGSGQAFAFGDAPYFGDVTTAVPGYAGHAVGIAATPG